MKQSLTVGRQGGFTLVELTVVIAIIGLLLAVVLAPLATRVKASQFQDQERKLDQIRDALIGYAQTQGRLPCPDTGNDGVEDACGTPAVGNLPYATLGTGAVDRWGRRYLYAVSANMTVPALTGQPPPTAGVDLNDVGVLTVNDRPSDKTPVAVSTSAAAVVVSLGANGFGGTNSDGATLAAPTGADELENTDGDNVFVARIRTDGGAGCSDTGAGSVFCEFDDLVTLIPTPLLLGKMVQAGQLP